MESLFKVREFAVVFNRYNKLSQKLFVSSDQILTGLRKKLNIDSTIVGANKYDLDEDISDLTKKIAQNEQDISKSMIYLNTRQEELCCYLLKFNEESNGNRPFEYI
jgi:hypothetical protein